MNYSDIKAFVDDGKSASEIAGLLNMDFRHCRDVKTRDLLAFLVNSVEVLDLGGNNKFEGPLKLAVDAAGDAELQRGFRQLLANMTLMPEGTIHTATRADVGQLAFGLTALAKGAEPERAVKIQNGMDSLTGGRKFGAVTEQQVQNLIDQNKKESSLAAIKARSDAAYEAAQEEFRKGDSTPASITAAGEEAF